jgi:hypothetical protein
MDWSIPKLSTMLLAGMAGTCVSFETKAIYLGVAVFAGIMAIAISIYDARIVINNKPK